MYTVLSTRRLLLETDPYRLKDYALAEAFDALEPSSTFFGSGDARVQAEYVAEVQDAGLRWGMAVLPPGLGVNDDDAFRVWIEHCRILCGNLARAGVDTVNTWVRPASDELTSDEQFTLHVRQLNALSDVLSTNGLRLALEYVGPATWRAGMRYPFIHSLAGLRTLLAALDRPGDFGFLVDTFHWYTAGETVDDFRALDGRDVLGVDLNDALRGVPRDEQLDRQRAQPGTTGVIDVESFVRVLREIGTTAGVQSEPFSDALELQPEEIRIRESRRALADVLGESVRS